MILHKLIAGRLIDRADVAVLLQRNAATIDHAYLNRWAAELGLQEELTAARRDAGESDE